VNVFLSIGLWWMLGGREVPTSTGSVQVSCAKALRVLKVIFPLCGIWVC